MPITNGEAQHGYRKQCRYKNSTISPYINNMKIEFDTTTH